MNQQLMSDVKPQTDPQCIYDATTMREVLEWSSDNVEVEHDRIWSVFHGKYVVHAPTLYQALHAAWSSRKDNP